MNTYKISKQAMTAFLSSSCLRQLRINLVPEPVRKQQSGPDAMPEKHPRPGLTDRAAAGEEWANTCVEDLIQQLPAGSVVEEHSVSSAGKTTYQNIPITQAGLARAVPSQVLIEHEYSVGQTFRRHFPVLSQADHTVEFTKLRPDIIFVVEPGSEGNEVLPDGSMGPILKSDNRRQLRIVDIKLNEDPGTGYLMEAVFYAVALAGWLEDQSLQREFLVRADPGIWPGSHVGSTLHQTALSAASEGRNLTPEEVLDSVEKDLVIAQPAVLVHSLQNFFGEHLPKAMDEPDWQALPFHVNALCRGCDYLGMRWSDAQPPSSNSCIPTTKVRDHLSRIPRLSRGAAGVLDRNLVQTVADVTTASDEVFDEHHSLRGRRSVTVDRADRIRSDGDASLIRGNIATASLPRWADAQIHVVANFDSSTAITFTLGADGIYSGTQNNRLAKPISFRVVEIVERREVDEEQTRVINFLAEIGRFVDKVRKHDENASLQVYVWDQLTYDHLCRVAGRHLDAVLGQPGGAKSLAWLFPPEEILANAQLVLEPAICVVNQPVDSLLATRTPFYYSLLSTARDYHRSDAYGSKYDFAPPTPLWEDPFSSQIPSERAHEKWKQASGSARVQQEAFKMTLTQLSALQAVRERLREDLDDRHGLRRWAPKVKYLKALENPGKMTSDELLWYAHTKLKAAVAEQAASAVHALTPPEREASFESARLSGHLIGAERARAMAHLGLLDAEIEIYRIAEASRDAKFSEGEFACAIVPEDHTELLNQRFSNYLEKRGAAAAGLLRDAQAAGVAYLTMDKVLGLDIVGMDRTEGLLAVKGVEYKDGAHWRRRLMDAGLIDLAGATSLEKLSVDIMSGRLKTTLKAIGKTPKALDHMMSSKATGNSSKVRATPRVPVEDLVWDSEAMAGTAVARNVPHLRHELEAAGQTLDDNQWAAVEHALTHRLSVIWGPPGTGKSRTLSRILAGAVLDAKSKGEGVRILLTANTYDATDNVMKSVAGFLPNMVPDVELWRLQTEGRAPMPAPVIACCTSHGTDEDTDRLRTRLAPGTNDVTIVAANPHQVHKLVFTEGGRNRNRKLRQDVQFDVVVVDEASQVDVASSIVSLISMAENSTVVVAGDKLQLAPISQVAPPVGLEHMVGSLYEFLVTQRGIDEQELLINYRSNREIIEAFKIAGYPLELTAHAPGKRLALAAPVPTTRPHDWPADLPWSDDYAKLLDPETPVLCLLHDDELSGQSNEMEASLVVALAHLLNTRLAASSRPSAGPLDLQDFLNSGLGIVTPHRAQRSAITSRLAQLWPTADLEILGKTVDTVEHFQGQQREIIIASYGVGDPDVIAGEEEFLQSLNRFNVTASRPETKLIVIMARTLVDHLASDLKVLDNSSMMKRFVTEVCANLSTVTFQTGADVRQMEMRWS
ncbi:AAA domain-containing protein [Kocuria rhizophila]|uniref:AAA domain-containing protein n=1 Tax=Kocuria rhizophila TaxID=72000 RepID=UPI0009E5CB28|nr:AAA domain-containing protein [Kocuria rhizophila]